MSLRALASSRTSRAIVGALALVLLCAVSLRQAIQRTPINKDTVGFRFSKTLELPHKKAASVAFAVAVSREPVLLHAIAAQYLLPPVIIRLPHDIAVRPASPRAPPLV